MGDMDDGSTTPKHRRRWFRYSLRSALLVTLVLSVWMAQQARHRDAVQVIVQPDQVPLLIVNLESNQTLANHFAVNQCEKLGPDAVDTLPALIELRARTSDADFRQRIDRAIAAVEGK